MSYMQLANWDFNSWTSACVCSCFLSLLMTEVVYSGSISVFSGWISSSDFYCIVCSGSAYIFPSSSNYTESMGPSMKLTRLFGFSLFTASIPLIFLFLRSGFLSALVSRLVPSGFILSSDIGIFEITTPCLLPIVDYLRSNSYDSSTVATGSSSCLLSMSGSSLWAISDSFFV